MLSITLTEDEATEYLSLKKKLDKAHKRIFTLEQEVYEKDSSIAGTTSKKAIKK